MGPALYLVAVNDPRAICAECGHVRSWHDREAARALRRGELPSDQQCYREIGGAGCRCRGFRDSGEVALATRPSMGRQAYLNGVLALLLVIMGLALLYAYRSQTQQVVPIDYSQAVQEINAGQVKKVTIEPGRATLELWQYNEKQQTTLPDRIETFEKMLADYNIANPSRQITIVYPKDSGAFPVIGSILVSLVPVLLVGAFFFYMFRRSALR
jgi:hypothetical protein